MSLFSQFPKMGLRARLVVSFALGAALISIVLSVITWSLTRENLLRQRDESGATRVFSNAMALRRSLAGPSADIETLLGTLPTPEGGLPMVFHDGSWRSLSPVEFSQNDLPVELQQLVNDGEAARMRVTVNNEPYLVVGVPIAATGSQYYEGIPLAQVQGTLQSLSISLLGASVVTTLAGGLMGFWASRRVLVPLSGIGRAAEAIAAGELDTRLSTGDDPDLDRLIDSFNRMVEALEDRIERDARFASEVSHELRSPLMTVAASIEVLENARSDLSPRAQTALDLLSADMRRFHQLVEDLLEISRFDVGAVRLHAAPTLLTELVIHSAAASGHPRVPVHYEEDAAEVVVNVDRTRFSRVIDNLLENADRYAGGATSITIELHGPGTGGPPTVRLAVEDAGHGVPEEERVPIFDRFSRGREGGNRGADSGTGLGLALVDEHVRLHGGRVWVEDRLDGKAGARFVVELPVLPETDDPDEGDTLDSVDADSASSAARPTESGALAAADGSGP
ncbi:MAG: HAMP domain-containing histidine kinase [Acidimicrobiia bacterium]|nr:HAMP domain-containing histidine kinase [Acidimicrobiia bacterium]